MATEYGKTTEYGKMSSEMAFAEYRLFHRALLQKRPVILRSLLIVAPPYGKTTESGKTWSEMAFKDVYLHTHR